jgi:selenocysteine lyase/cysteine desulfurase
MALRARLVVLAGGRRPGGIAVSGDRPAVAIDLGTPALDVLRRTEFTRLDAGGHHYFDYTGSGLAPERLVREHAELLSAHALGNPHSFNPTSSPATELVEAARARLLAHLGADGGEHVCIFTANASAALKLVGESFDFAGRPRLVLTADNHNSVNGIREFARRAGARVDVAPVVAPELRLDDAAADALLAQGPPGLFAYPAQSNYSGVQHPLDLAATARERGWAVVLDAAAFAPTNRLDLSAVPADFTCLSIYKMLGYPTGVGALVARRDALAALRRPWFAGGTIAMASVAADAHRLTPGAAGFEDGTPNFLSIPAVTLGLDILDEVGLDAVHERVGRATAALLEGMSALRHANGEPVVRLLGPTGTAGRGGTVAFNVHDPEGRMVHDRRVQELASEAGISLRSGCFCNPGAGEAARGLGARDLAPLFARADVPDFCDLDDLLWSTRGSGASALRASVGWVTDAGDLHALLGLLGSFRDVHESDLGAPDPATEQRGPDSP